MRPDPAGPVDREGDEPSRREVLRGGIAGLGTGVLLLGVALTFLVRPLAEPQHALGVFLPLGVALVAVALGALALLPLALGDTVETAGRAVVLLRGWAAVGLALTLGGVLRGDLPWTVGALVPLAAVALLLRDAGRLAGVVAAEKRDG